MRPTKQSSASSESAAVKSAVTHLQNLLAGVGGDSDIPIAKEVAISGVESSSRFRARVDLVASMMLRGVYWRFFVEVATSGEPRIIRERAWSLQQVLKSFPSQSYGIVIAPFFSKESREILREGGFGWLDLAGNCRLVFENVHIEIDKSVKNPFIKKRAQRSLFAPKSARVLRLLLANPRSWKVSELASRGYVSVGQVSKVRQALLEKEWAVAEVGGGLRLHRPEAVLNAWCEAVRRPEISLRGYTLLHGKDLDARLRHIFGRAPSEGASVLLASFSVARRLAPFARIAGEFFYADAPGVELIKQELQVQPANKGENIIIQRPTDELMFDEAIELASGLRGTSFVQTYLDMWSWGDRGREAAEHFRREAMVTGHRGKG